MKSRYLTNDEIARIQARLGLDGWLPFAVALETGLRVSDVVALTWRNIRGNRISYIAKKTRKTGEATISPELRVMLDTRRRASHSPWVFPSPRDLNRHITRQALWRRLKTAAAIVTDADGVSPHSFRKVFGVNEYHEHGVRAVQEALQHTNIGTTEIYALADWELDADAPLTRGDLPRILHYIADYLSKR